MFTSATPPTFGSTEMPQELTATFTALREVVAMVAHDDIDTLTEMVWSALHSIDQPVDNRSAGSGIGDGLVGAGRGGPQDPAATIT